MADNTELDVGAGGDVIATDDIAGVKHQRVKIQYGTDGAATDVSDTNPLPIDDAGGSITVDFLSLPAGNNNIGDVDVASSALPTGASTSAKQDTVIGHLDGVEGLLTTIDADTGAVAAAVAGTEVQVDVVAALPAGNNNIGDVDVASSVLPSGAATSAKQDTIIGHVDGIEGLLTTIDGDTSNLSVVGSGTEATAQRVTIATDSTGVLSVDDNGASLSIDDGGNTITVDGTVTANLAAGTNNIGDVDVLTVPADPFGANADAAATAGSTGSIQAKLRLLTSQLDAVKTAVETLDNVVAGSEAQVDVVGALPAGTASIGGVTIRPQTANGLSIFRTLDADETEEAVKTSAGQLYGWYFFNAVDAIVYIKIYDATVANVTVGSTTPVLTIPIPALSAANAFSEVGIAFANAITIAATTGVADGDSAAPAANQVIANVFYA